MTTDGMNRRQRRRLDAARQLVGPDTTILAYGGGRGHARMSKGVVGLAAGGDRAAADAVRQVIRKPGSVYLGHPIRKRWVDHDANGAKDPAFTPWHTR